MPAITIVWSDLTRFVYSSRSIFVDLNCLVCRCRVENTVGFVTVFVIRKIWVQIREKEANNDTVTTEYLPIHDRMSACLFDHEIGLGFPLQREWVN